MSTNWGFVCLSHDPPLASEHWFNHGEDVLRDAWQKERADEWPDDPKFTAWAEPLPVVLRSAATASPIFWLRQHPNCTVGLHNEYGDIEPLAETLIVRPAIGTGADR